MSLFGFCQGCLDSLFPSLVAHYDKFVGQLERRNPNSGAISSPTSSLPTTEPIPSTRTPQRRAVPRLQPLTQRTPSYCPPASRPLSTDSEIQQFKTASSAPANDNYTPTVTPPSVWYSRLMFRRPLKAQPPGSRMSRPTH